MQKGLKSRFIIHEILKSLKNKSLTFDKLFEDIQIKHQISISDKKLIHNVVLNSMRYSLIIEKILYIYSKKVKKNSNEYFLLLSAITQIIFLNFKEYAVINSTVELAKINTMKTYHGFINATLRNIARDKKILYETKEEIENLPIWFRKKINHLNQKKILILLQTLKEKPQLHIVFKNEKNINKFQDYIKTSEYSIAIENTNQIEKLPGYNSGDWWVQDFSSMMPLYLSQNLSNKSVVDMCSAPGGKSFQLLKYNVNLTSYEKNSQRKIIMESNIKRLNFNHFVKNKDSLKIDNEKKFDIVLIDAPCSSIGTLRKNPEILYRTQEPNFKKLFKIQSDLLQKAKLLLKNQGLIIYIVCSFFLEEGEMQINNFLKKNPEFKLKKFISKNSSHKQLINEKGFFYSTPQKFEKKLLIDGFFAAKLYRND